MTYTAHTAVRITTRRHRDHAATVLRFDAFTGLYDLRVAVHRDDAPPGEYDTKCPTVRLGPNQFCVLVLTPHRPQK